MMNKRLIKFGVLMALMACSLSVFAQHCDYSKADSWYKLNTKMIDKNKVDVFYIVSTNVGNARDEKGNKVWRAVLNADDRAILGEEMQYLKDTIFQKQFNFFAPFYHQMTFESADCIKIKETKDKFMKEVQEEVFDAFDYYMAHYNNGRRFIIAGFSQGAILELELLKHMTDEQYKRMVCAYCMGYRLTADDLKQPHFKAAKGAKDTGVIVSFNSVAAREGMWPLVNEGAVTCINPVNWRTDSTPAKFTYAGETGTVAVDKKGDVLIVNLNTPKYNAWMANDPVWSKTVNPNNRHYYELVFYAPYIHKNAVMRAYPSTKKTKKNRK